MRLILYRQSIINEQKMPFSIHLVIKKKLLVCIVCDLLDSRIFRFKNKKEEVTYVKCRHICINMTYTRQKKRISHTSNQFLLLVLSSSQNKMPTYTSIVSLFFSCNCTRHYCLVHHHSSKLA